MSVWAIKNSYGRVLLDFKCASPLDVAQKMVAVPYDPFRLRVSSSYREVFERAVSQVLQREGWRIVRISGRKAEGASPTTISSQYCPGSTSLVVASHNC